VTPRTPLDHHWRFPEWNGSLSSKACETASSTAGDQRGDCLASRGTLDRMDDRDVTQHDPRLSEDQRVRLQQLDEGLDQCWDLLRQRRAREESGEDPDAAKARPVGEAEGYLQ
jgi:hypothetical protein